MKDLKKELEEMNSELKSLNSNITELTEKVIDMTGDVSNSLNTTATELHETNITVRDSMKQATDAVIAMSESITKIFGVLKIGDTGENLLKGLGLDGLIPGFKKKKRL